MTKVSDLHTLWLKPHHLPEQGTNVTIEQVTIEQLHPRPGQTRQGIVLRFKGKSRRLIVNAGNANRLADIAGEETDGWPGHVIRLTPSLWGSKPTILIEPVKEQHDGRS